MVVLGVDPGSLNTGYGVVSQSSGVLSVLVCGVIRLNPRRTHAERIGEIYRELEAVIDDFKPERLALEIYQNCPIFNNAAFEAFASPDNKADNTVYLEQDKPLVFGKEKNKGIRLEGFTPIVVDLNKEGLSTSDLWVHNEADINKASILARFADDRSQTGEVLPRPFGVFYAEDRVTYEDALTDQIRDAQKNGLATLEDLLKGESSYVIK